MTKICPIYMTRSSEETATLERVVGRLNEVLDIEYALSTASTATIYNIDSIHITFDGPLHVCRFSPHHFMESFGIDVDNLHFVSFFISIDENSMYVTLHYPSMEAH